MVPSQGVDVQLVGVVHVEALWSCRPICSTEQIPTDPALLQV
jgi:hypothetical protein